ncbi:MAG: T9SS type A sorting domain-containing protein [Bacteroidales bacterium]
MKNRLLILFILAIPAVFLQGQNLVNQGYLVVPGGYLTIQGNYVNQSSGTISLDGTIQVNGNWTNNGSGNICSNPDATGEVVFNGTSTQTIGGSGSVFDFDNLRINNGAIVEVTPGKGVTTYGDCNFNAPLVLKSTTTAFRPQMATFINHGAVNGNITSELSYTTNGYTASGVGRGLHLASPITNGTSTIFNVAAGLNKLYYHDEVARTYPQILTNGTTLISGEGYILRSATSQVFNFTGTPFTASSYSNSNIQRIAAGHSLLVGNPYPAVIDWQTISTKTNLYNTIWYRTCSTSGTMLVDTWNGTTLVGTNNNGTAAVDGKIPPMQSFWVQVSVVGNTGALTIRESDRTHSWGNAPFLKKGAVNSGKGASKEILRLYMYSGENRDEQILVQTDQAGDSLEPWDSRKFFLNDSSKLGELFTLAPEGERLVIQSVKPVLGEKNLPIGLANTKVGNSFTFKADLSNVSSRCNYFLEDKKFNTLQDLRLNPEYTFTVDVTNDNLGDRFTLKVLQSPYVELEDTVEICSGSSANLTQADITTGSAEGLSFSYWVNEMATVECPNPDSVGSGAYFIKGTADNGAYSIGGPVVVKAWTNPSISVVNPSPVCSPGTVDLTTIIKAEVTSPGLHFSYFTDAGASVEYVTPETATNGEYFIKGTDTNGCSVISEMIPVIVNQIPKLIVNNPDTIASNGSIDLTAPGITEGSDTGLIFTYWLDEAASNPFSNPQVADEGTYYIRAQNTNTGCISSVLPVVVISTSIPGTRISEMRVFSSGKQIFIENCTPHSNISVMDVLGRVCYTGIANSDRVTISLHSESGIYFVKVRSEEKNHSQKVYLQ